MVKIIPIDGARKDEFYEVFRELMREGYDNFSEKLKQYFFQNDYRKEIIDIWVDKSYRKVLLAIDENNNKIIGFLVGDNTYGGVAFISWIGVLPEYRKRGIAKNLFLEYEKFAKEKKAHLIELFTYEKIKQFYFNLGFKEIGRREVGFYGSENIIMNKTIGNWSDNSLIIDL